MLDETRQKRLRGYMPARRHIYISTLALACCAIGAGAGAGAGWTARAVAGNGIAVDRTLDRLETLSARCNGEAAMAVRQGIEAQMDRRYAAMATGEKLRAINILLDRLLMFGCAVVAPPPETRLAGS